ncbi:MAG TPA: hypothetical protein VMR41_05450 [Patescibacteria group bacterium]|nr:hypothetical protein [Patescibacteria group bacterium]
MAKGAGFSKLIQNAGGYVNQYVGNNIFLNSIFFVIIVLFILYLIKKLKQ